MASPEETKEGLINSDKRPEAATNRQTINCDETENKHLPSTSKLVPTFNDTSKNDPNDKDHKTESEVSPMTINEKSHLISQLCQSTCVQCKQNGPNLEQRNMKDENCINNCCNRKSFGKKPQQHSCQASAISMASININRSKKASISGIPPDGGFGWIVVAAAFVVNLIGDGVTFSFGIMFEEFQDEFGSSSAVTAGVVSVFHAVPLITGPIATWLIDRYGCRAVTIIGAILAASGFLAAAFSTHIALLYLFFGIISGFGLSLCDVASVIIVAYYFDRRRSFATGISVCGSGVGTFLFAPLTQWLMDHYGGWRGACIILGGVFLNLIVCGMMFKELNWNKNGRQSDADLIHMPECDEPNEAIDQSQDDMNTKHTSSLITIPSYFKDASRFSEEKTTTKPFLEKATENITIEDRPAMKAKIMPLQSLGFRHQSITCIEAYKQRNSMKSSSCPDIYKNASDDNDATDEEGSTAKCSINNCCNLNYVSLPFLIFCFSNFILYFWYDVPYVYTIEYSENILNVPNSDSAHILSVIGILNTIGEVLVGWLSDQPWVSSAALYASCMCVCGLVTALIPFATGYSMVLVLSAAYGFCISANYSLTSPILVDLVSIGNFSSAYGFLLACQGVGNLVGPPFAGWLYDISGAWFLTFDLAGFFIATSGLLLIIIPFFTVFRRYFIKVIFNDSFTIQSSNLTNRHRGSLNKKDIICDDGCGKSCDV